MAASGIPVGLVAPHAEVVVFVAETATAWYVDFASAVAIFGHGTPPVLSLTTIVIYTIKVNNLFT